jgi:hypothetical protein
MQRECSIPCAIAYSQSDEGRKSVIKAKKKETRQMKREHRERNLQWWLSVQSTESNKNGGNTAYWLHKWIREVRDKGKPCIMCNKPITEKQQAHASHFRSRGAAPQHRFNPDNIHSGHSHCNVYTTGDTATNYRRNLVERIGEERVLALELDNAPHKWTIDGCRAIRDEYKRLVKACRTAP